MNYLGNAGLSDKEKVVHTEVSAGIGCWTKVGAAVLALLGMQISFQLLIVISSTHFFSFKPDNFSQNSSTVTAFALLCLSGLFTLGIGRLVYAVIMMLARQKFASNMISEQERLIKGLQSEISELKNKLERTKWQLVEAEKKAV